MGLFNRIGGQAAVAPAGGLLKRTRPLFMKATRVNNFKRTTPNHEFKGQVFAAIFGMPFYGFMPAWPTLFFPIQWFFGACYPILPWVILWLLVHYLLVYGSRIADYDRGQMLNYNHCYQEGSMSMYSILVRETNAWRNICDHFLHRGDEDIKSGKWTRADDGSVEPSSENISPGGLAAFHLISSISLRWDLINFVREWNDSWVRKCHNVLIQPTWIIGGNEDVHNLKRSYVGDWTYVVNSLFFFFFLLYGN